LLRGALLIYGLIGVEKTRGWVLPKFLQSMGDVSYSMYIWHQFVFGALLYLSRKAGLLNVVPDIVLIPAWGVIAVGWGFVAYRIVEAPVLGATKRLMGRMRTAA
jgi:exopolysaccharide production protein ExoZ